MLSLNEFQDAPQRAVARDQDRLPRHDLKTFGV